MGIEIAVVFHAASQLTARQARAVLEGVGRVEGARAHLLDVDDFAEGAYEWTALDKADAIVFGTPTFLGAMPAEFRRFRERSAKRRWANKLAAGFTCAGSQVDGDDAGLRHLANLAQERGMLWVNPTVADDPEVLGQRVAEAAMCAKGSA